MSRNYDYYDNESSDRPRRSSSRRSRRSMDIYPEGPVRNRNFSSYDNEGLRKGYSPYESHRTQQRNFQEVPPEPIAYGPQFYNDHEPYYREQGFSNVNETSFYGRGPKTYKRSDERIKEDVCELLTEHPDIDASDVEVDVDEGCITFSGHVPTTWMKYECEAMAEGLNGVQQIDNNLSIKTPGTFSDRAKDFSSPTRKTKNKSESKVNKGVQNG